MKPLTIPGGEVVGLTKHIDLQRALIAYAVIVCLMFFVMYSFIKVRSWPALILSLIAGQVGLNVLFMPLRLDFWCEFESSVALYGFIQAATPLVVMVYAINCALHDRKTCSL